MYSFYYSLFIHLLWLVIKLLRWKHFGLFGEPGRKRGDKEQNFILTFVFQGKDSQDNVGSDSWGEMTGQKGDAQ